MSITHQYRVSSLRRQARTSCEVCGSLTEQSRLCLSCEELLSDLMRLSLALMLEPEEEAHHA